MCVLMVVCVMWGGRRSQAQTGCSDSMFNYTENKGNRISNDTTQDSHKVLTAQVL